MHEIIPLVLGCVENEYSIYRGWLLHGQARIICVIFLRIVVIIIATNYGLQDLQPDAAIGVGLQRILKPDGVYNLNSVINRVRKVLSIELKDSDTLGTAITGVLAALLLHVPLGEAVHKGTLSSARRTDN